MTIKRTNPTSSQNKAGDEDSDLWRRVADGVTPLKKRVAAPKPKSQPQRVQKTSATPSRPVHPAPAQSPISPPPELSHGSIAGLDKRTGERLKRGKLPIEGRLDLHGMTQVEAHQALSGFISGQRVAGKRCVIVITGKGSYRGGGGVLKDAVPRWLNEPALRDHILAFNHAQPRHGGAGALYVLLRRMR